MLLDVHGSQKNNIQQLTTYVVGERENLKLAWNTVKEIFPHGVPPVTLVGATILGYENQPVEIDTTITRES